ARPATLAATWRCACCWRRPASRVKPARGAALLCGPRAGLLSGSRSPYARGAEPPGRAGASPEPQLHPRLRSLVSPAGGPGADGVRRQDGAVCVQDVAPNLQRCERLPDGRGTSQCKADVFLSLRSADCRAP
uniref:Uncharacterized protein n=1 Tax=Rhinopithecus bieti TaxID=61621 RepID=A0A2K6MAY2_RHIBE